MLRGRRGGAGAIISYQILQIVAITSVGSFTYVTLAGLQLRVVVATTGVAMRLGAGGQFAAAPWAQVASLDAVGLQFEFGGGIMPQPLSASTFTVGINVVAAFFAYRLLALRSIGTEPHPMTVAATPPQSH